MSMSLQALSSRITSWVNGLLNRSPKVQNSPIDQAARDVLARSLTFLPAKDLVQASLVDHKFNQITSRSDFWNPIIRTSVFGKEEWEKYIGDPGEVPPLPKGWEKEALKPCEIWKGKRFYETHMLLFIPKTINGQPFNLNTLSELVQKPLAGNATKFSYIWDQIIAQFGDKTVDEGQWVWITKDVIPGTGNKSYAGQEAIVTGKGYEVPSLLPLVTAIFMNYIVKGTFLYGQTPWTFSRTLEQINGDHLVAGGFAAAGLDVNDSDLLWDHEDLGMGALRKVLPSMYAT